MTINPPQNQSMCECRMFIIETSVSPHEWTKTRRGTEMSLTHPESALVGAKHPTSLRGYHLPGQGAVRV
jgi:hypothetical protein